MPVFHLLIIHCSGFWHTSFVLSFIRLCCYVQHTHIYIYIIFSASWFVFYFRFIPEPTHDGRNNYWQAVCEQISCVSWCQNLVYLMWNNAMSNLCMAMISELHRTCQWFHTQGVIWYYWVTEYYAAGLFWLCAERSYNLVYTNMEPIKVWIYSLLKAAPASAVYWMSVQVLVDK